jgi:pimeloyl-ACP methyl ester carboxylesterase
MRLRADRCGTDYWAMARGKRQQAAVLSRPPRPLSGTRSSARLPSGPGAHSTWSWTAVVLAGRGYKSTTDHVYRKDNAPLDMKPTVLLIHGSWHSPAHLAPLRALLEARGYAVRCPALPSVGGPPHAALREDAAAVVAELARLLARGADVLVVAHSYGGAVASEAARPELGKAARAARGLQGGVVHLLYLCAFVLPAGQSVVDACASAGPMPLAIDVCRPPAFTLILLTAPRSRTGRASRSSRQGCFTATCRRTRRRAGLQRCARRPC